MLVLTRRPSESIIIAGDIKITVVSVGPGRVKIGIEAPPHVRVDRQEIHEKIEQSSDVLAAVAGEIGAGTHNTMVSSASDTATSLPSRPVDLPAVSKGEPVAPSPLGKLSKFRKPR